MDSENERKTRGTRIDPKLASAGWNIARFDASRSLSDFPQCAIEEYETDNGPADYALNVDSVLLGIVEAKKSPSVLRMCSPRLNDIR
jgi:type I restriction enzyme R subunit